MGELFLLYLSESPFLSWITVRIPSSLLEMVRFFLVGMYIYTSVYSIVEFVFNDESGAVGNPGRWVYFWGMI